MFDFIIGWKEKLIGIGLALVLFWGWITKVKWQARREGAKAVTDAIKTETEKTKNEWQKIDDTPLGVDDALRRLRERARREGHNP